MRPSNFLQAAALLRAAPCSRRRSSDRSASRCGTNVGSLQPVEEHAGDARPLGRLRRLLLHERGHEHDLAIAEAVLLLAASPRRRRAALSAAASTSCPCLTICVEHLRRRRARRGSGRCRGRGSLRASRSGTPSERAKRRVAHQLAAASSRVADAGLVEDARPPARMFLPSGIVTATSSIGHALDQPLEQLLRRHRRREACTDRRGSSAPGRARWRRSGTSSDGR